MSVNRNQNDLTGQRAYAAERRPRAIACAALDCGIFGRRNYRGLTDPQQLDQPRRAVRYTSREIVGKRLKLLCARAPREQARHGLIGIRYSRILRNRRQRKDAA